MRRSDREIKDHDEILDVIRRCDVCRLALHDEPYPYIVPLNFGFEEISGKLTLYFHSALTGHKLDRIAADPRAAFEMDTSHVLLYSEEKQMCTMAYESVIGFGTIHFLEEEEKYKALKKLMDHYYPGEEKSFPMSTVPHTAVFSLEVESLTGKRRVASL